MNSEEFQNPRRVVLLTADQTRHRFVASRLAGEVELVGIVCEEKPRSLTPARRVPDGDAEAAILETVRRLGDRYGVDRKQSSRIESSAIAFLEQVSGPWRLEGQERKAMLRWAARLHEIGLTISHAQYHKHGGYLLQHGDLAGFSRLSRRTTCQ